MAERREAAADVEHTIARLHPARGIGEFLPAVVLAPELALHEAGVEGGVERVIARQQRVEEVQPRRRLPQPEARHALEARPCVGAHLKLPELGEKPRIDPLDETRRGFAGHRAGRIAVRLAGRTGFGARVVRQ
jgi:hypothetical protein